LCYGSITHSAEDIVIKAGTPVPVRILDAVSSETATAGSTVRSEVTRDITINGKVLIKAGTDVVAEIAYAQKPGSLGKEGKVNLVLRHTTAIDGTRVPLRALLEQSGDEKVALSWMVCPFIKGSGAMISSGTETKAYVDYDVKIRID